MNSCKIAMFDSKEHDKAYFQAAVDGYESVDITFYPSRLSETTVKLARDFDVVCAFINDDLNKEVLDRLHEYGIELIVLRSAGYNNVDLKGAFGRIHVLRVPDYSPYAIAEHAMALIMTLNRKTHKAYFRTRENNFSIDGLLGFDMHGKVVGIVGTGKIGRVMVQLLSGYGVEVVAYDPYPNETWAQEMGVRYVELDELFGQSDIISLHCPLTPENVHLIDDEAIGKMKKGVMLINTGRGALIDTPALIEGLKAGNVGYAGLDVYEEETEYFFENLSNQIIEDDVLARLLSFPNVLVTSHQGFFTREALKNIAGTTLENIRLYFEKNELPNEICYNCSEGTCKRKETGRCF